MNAELAGGQTVRPDALQTPERPLAGKTVVITGTSRGVGASTAIEFAWQGADILGTHKNPGLKRRGMQTAVFDRCREVYPKGHFKVVIGDITDPMHQQNLADAAVNLVLGQSRKVYAVILNAAGGLERDRDEGYAREINVVANMALVDNLTPYMNPGGIFIYIQSLWGHLFEDEIYQEERYGPIADSKHEAEMELLKRQDELSMKGIRVGIVVGDVIKDTDMYKLLERIDKERLEREERLVPGGKYPTTADMARRIVAMSMRIGQTGNIEYVGRTREQYLEQFRAGLIPRSAR